MAKKGYVGFGMSCVEKGKYIIFSIHGIGVIDDKTDIVNALNMMFKDASEKDVYLDYRINRSFQEVVEEEEN